MTARPAALSTPAKLRHLGGLTHISAFLFVAAPLAPAPSPRPLRLPPRAPLAIRKPRRLS